eukprot:COSAG01_NODE_625_length_14726_cov_9.023997_20_plen_102_part_00
MLRGCDLAETMHVRDGTAELHGCVVHDSESEGVLADSYQFNAASVVLVDTIVERCKAWSVYSCGGGVVETVTCGGGVVETVTSCATALHSLIAQVLSGTPC